jgi:hypothetical protein
MWPFNVLSLFHPFRISEKIDIDLEQSFNLNIPFLNLRIGVQGVGESFSFVVARNTPKKLRYSNLQKEDEQIFFNDMNWKISRYVSTSMSTFILSVFVAIIEYR